MAKTNTNRHGCSERGRGWKGGATSAHDRWWLLRESVCVCLCRDAVAASNVSLQSFTFSCLPRGARSSFPKLSIQLRYCFCYEYFRLDYTHATFGSSSRSRFEHCVVVAVRFLVLGPFWHTSGFLFLSLSASLFPSPFPLALGLLSPLLYYFYAYTMLNNFLLQRGALCAKVFMINFIHTHTRSLAQPLTHSHSHTRSHRNTLVSRDPSPNEIQAHIHTQKGRAELGSVRKVRLWNSDSALCFITFSAFLCGSISLGFGSSRFRALGM